MDNLALQIIDEENEIDEGFKIDNDNLAEWALRKISEEQINTQRYINVCDTVIAEYQHKKKKVQDELDRKTSYFKSCLLEYFGTVNKNKTKTQETYKLPSGTLKLKYQKPEFVRDDEKLLKCMKNLGNKQFIKTQESVDWASLKKEVTVTGNSVIDSDGVIIDGVTVAEREPIFSIEIGG